MFLEEPIDSLQEYIKSNIFEISSFFDSNYQNQKKYRWKVDDWCIKNENDLNNLDYSQYYNSLFVLSLLEYAEKFSLKGSFNVLYNISYTNNLNIGHRQRAAKMFLLEVNLKEDYLKIFEYVIENLQIAYETEEDDEVKVLQTFGNYILNVAKATADVNVSILESVIAKVKSNRNEFSILVFDFAEKLINSVPQSSMQYIDWIQSIVEQLYFESKQIQFFVPNYILEEGTEYANVLNRVSINFDAIRQVSMDIYNSYSGDKKSMLRDELLRGVKIIDREDLLFAYMTLYGKKHQKKLNHTFSKIKNLPINYMIIDWACGQGLASMLFIDRFDKNNCKKIILNEPSTLSLKRAALHLKKYSGAIEVKTINKMIEDIAANDIKIDSKFATIHLFSNILDININRNHIFQLIEQSCIGFNYFICVSPYIDDIRTNRIDLFMNYFSNKYKTEVLQNENIKNSDPTMVIRVFTSEIPLKA